MTTATEASDNCMGIMAERVTMKGRRFVRGGEAECTVHYSRSAAAAHAVELSA